MDNDATNTSKITRVLMIMCWPFLVYVPTSITLEWVRIAISALSHNDMDCYHAYIFLALKCNSKEMGLGTLDACLIELFMLKVTKPPGPPSALQNSSF